MASRYCYPPLMYSSLPAIIDGDVLRIKFNLSNLNFQDEIKHIQFIISYQINNKSAVNSDQWLNNIIYIPWNAVRKEGTLYYCDILGDNLEKGKWEAGNYYKIQARFGLSEFPGQSGAGFDYTQLAEWERNCQEQNLFTEWSTVTVVKVIPRPEIGIIGLDDQSSTTVGRQYIDSNLGVFVGYYYNTDYKEIVNTYRFKIYEKLQDESLMLVVDSGELQHNSDNDYNISDYINQQSNISSIDIYKSNYLLEPEIDYVIEYTITTNNLYSKTISYNIAIIDDYSSPAPISIRCDTDEDEGGINIYLTSTSGNSINGNYILCRSSATSNYKIWEDLTYIYYENQTLNDTFAFEDLLIESGVGYKYGIQKVNKDQTRSRLVYEIDEDPIICYYENTFLYENGIQLKLAFNNRVSSFKQTHLESKIDAMGSKYPFITRNGITCYHEFGLSGLISYHMDEKEKFLNQKNIINFDSDENNREINGFISNSNLTGENVYLEKEFRKNVIDWLNNGKYKLFKSPTEGLMIIALLNSSFSPQETLGRMIYEFSTSAYEIAEFSINNLSELGTYKVGDYVEPQPIISNKMGQIIASATSDIYEEVRNQQEGTAGEGYINIVNKITSISVESSQSTGEDNIVLIINGNREIVGTSGIYTLNDVDIHSISLVEGTNVIINYICEVETTESNTEITTYSLLLSSFIINRNGQLQGSFSDISQESAYSSLNVVQEIWKREQELLLSEDSSYEYTFKNISYISIEADPGTILLFNDNEIIIGETGLYEINVDYGGTISFKEPTYALINYKCNVLKEKHEG